MVSDLKTAKTYDEHPFAQYVRILGKGKRGSRSLTMEEAQHAMHMILNNEVEDIQLGAFLMLLRVKEETPEELAGFVLAAKQHFNAPAGLTADLDWSSYAGKRRHLPWYLLSVLLLAHNGIRVMMHGAQGHTVGRLYTEDMLQHLGFEIATDWESAASHLDKQGFCYMPLSALSQRLADIINMRAQLGLRSPIHSMARLLNPLNAPTVLQGIFHPPYSELHQKAGQLLEYPCIAVIKGEGGEIERNPDNDMVVRSSINGEMKEDTWVSMFERRHKKADEMDAQHLINVWRGEIEDEYGESAVLGTLALALKYTGRCKNQDFALKTARDYWEARNIDLIND